VANKIKIPKMKLLKKIFSKSVARKNMIVMFRRQEKDSQALLQPTWV